MADFLLAHGLIQSPESDKSDMGCRKEDRINKFFPATENSKETSSIQKSLGKRKLYHLHWIFA